MVMGQTLRAGVVTALCLGIVVAVADRKSTRLNSSHSQISYAVFCLKKKILEFTSAAVTVRADQTLPLVDNHHAVAPRAYTTTSRSNSIILTCRRTYDPPFRSVPSPR